ncbi:MAG: glycine cleavage system protein GcvH [Cryobacterium sp.]|nr:glycine cleavage system protein GcvH [Cryobacterium sp.]
MSAGKDLKYTAEHEWLSIEGNVATIGITDYAAEKLGDVVFVDLPKVGAKVESGRVVGEIESTKSVGELFAPVSGTVVEVNAEVIQAPELVNDDPFGTGWMIKVEVENASVFASEDLMDESAYKALVGE